MGCQLCVKGLKEVIFVTGVCPKSPSCYFCPISDKKAGKDVAYANEWPIGKMEDFITEAKLCESKGAGLTGGDPLARFDRTVAIIKLLKQKFGKSFHIHLYTPLELVNEVAIKVLEEVGLDEIRFHPDIDNDKLWHRMSIKTKMIKGVEIPVIPRKEKEARKLIDFIKDKVKFLNLNELELSDANACKLYEHGFIAKDKISYAVKGSDALAKKLLQYCQSTNLNVHYCAVRLKDKVQLLNRIKRRAKHVKKPFDTLTKEGTLIRGAIYTEHFTPDSTLSKLEQIDKKPALAQLENAVKRLQKEYKIPARLLSIDERKLRILTTVKVVSELKKDLKKAKLYPAVVEELPTYDQFEIQAEML